MVKKVVVVAKKGPEPQAPKRGSEASGASNPTPPPPKPPQKRRNTGFLARCVGVVVQDLKSLVRGKPKEQNYDPLAAAHEKSKRGW